MVARETFAEGLGGNNPEWDAFSAPCVARVGSSFNLAFDGDVIENQALGYAGVFVAHAVTSASPSLEVLMTNLDTITVPSIGSNLDITMVGQPTVPALSQRGDKAWFINVTTQNTQVFLTKGPLTTDTPVIVCYEGMPVTGLGGDPIKKATAPFAIESFGTGANLDIGFHATTTTSTNGSSGIFRWDAQTSTVQVVQHTDDQVTGPSDLFFLIAGPSNSPFVAEFGGGVEGAFRATTTGPTGIGIWADNPASGVALVAKKDDSAFGTTSTFQEFRAPSVNSLGHVAFVGCLNPSCSDNGIWTTTSGSLSKIAAEPDESPDTTGAGSGEDFSSFSNPVLNESGAIAFRATILNESKQGIWRRGSEPGAVLKRILRTDDQLRGTPLVFSSFGEDIAIADSGEIAFTATLTDGKQGLFTTFQLGGTTKIVKIAKEEEFFLWDDVPTEEYRRIEDILFYPGAYAMGTTGFVHMMGSPAQPQAIGFVLKLAGIPSDPNERLALVLTTVEE